VNDEAITRSFSSYLRHWRGLAVTAMMNSRLPVAVAVTNRLGFTSLQERGRQGVGRAKLGQDMSAGVAQQSSHTATDRSAAQPHRWRVPLYQLNQCSTRCCVQSWQSAHSVERRTDEVETMQLSGARIGEQRMHRCIQREAEG
jgi:hypothetical protein